jgi:hypothetical protein
MPVALGSGRTVRLYQTVTKPSTSGSEAKTIDPSVAPSLYSRWITMAIATEKTKVISFALPHAGSLGSLVGVLPQFAA